MEKSLEPSINQYETIFQYTEYQEISVDLRGGGHSRLEMSQSIGIG